jgi:hypothetical protein
MFKIQNRSFHNYDSFWGSLISGKGFGSKTEIKEVQVGYFILFVSNNLLINYLSFFWF